MKKLVLGALIAATSFTGCTSDSGPDDPVVTDAVVTVSWNFTHLATNAARSCPTGYTTATVISQSIDPATHIGTGLKVKDKFDCSAGIGSLTLPDDTYLIWVEITDDGGTKFYAQTEEFFVDTTLGDKRFDTEILDDGGYVQMTWDLVDAHSGALLTCAAAGVKADGSVEITPSMAGSMDFVSDKFTCEDHFGTTYGLLAGDYVLSVAVNPTDNVADQPLGDVQNVNNVQVKAPNVITYVGNIMLPID